MVSKNKATTIFFIFLLVFLPGYPRAKSAGYGEENENLGQFVDDFENLDNVTVIEDLIRNATLDCIELNRTEGLSYGEFDNSFEVNIDHDRLDANLTAFPILLNISEDAGIGNDDLTDIFDEIGNSYLKIAITDLTQSTEYYVDVEYWNATEELGYLWFSRNVSSLENTTVVFFYDGSAANNTEYIGLSGSVVASNVWDEYFVCVLHLSQSSGNFLDSTSGNNDASAQGDSVIRGRQKIDSGVDLGGTDDYVRIDSNAMIDGQYQASIEIWVYLDTLATDQTIMGDWNAPGTETSLLYYSQASNKWRIIWRDNLPFATDAYFGTLSPLGAWYYVGGTDKQSDNVYAYENGIQTTGDVTFNRPLDSPNMLYYLGTRGDLVWDLNGKIDEFRMSNITRSKEYFNATYYTGNDNLVDWSISGAIGYELDGYFITTNYLNYANGSSLASLTNATIPENTEITVQFSNDNNTWVDHDGNIGSDILENGFYALDLRDLNYTDIYSMYNSSTSDTAITPRLYQSRLITTLGFGDITIANETIIINNITGEWIEYRLTEIGVLIGTHDLGFLNSTFDVDGNTYDCSEVAGAPGYVISFNWTDVDTDAHCLWVSVYVFYDGVSSHVIDIDLYNFDSETWITIGNIYDMAGFEWVNSSIYVLRLPNDYINSSGAVLGRFYHASPGNINDDISTDYLRLHAFVAFENGITVTEDNFFWVFIAIVLSIITALLVWMKFGNQ